MRRLSLLASNGAKLAIVVFVGATVVSAESASAQSAFCPAKVSAPPVVNGGTVPNIMLMSGNCTNPAMAGAFSGAALASQAIGDLAGSSTILETTAAIEAIGQRREAPPQACPSGEVLVDGICKPRPTPVTEVAAPPAAAPAVSAPVPAAPTVAKHRVNAKRVSRAPSVALPTKKAVYEGPPPAIYDQSFRIGSWAQGFGDYEHRTGDENSVFNCCTTGPGNTNITPVALSASSTTSSGGFVGGIDATKRGLLGPQDGIIFGLLGGYTWTNIALETTVLSSKPSQTASGSSRTAAHIDGPSLGAYVTYFNGPVSNDFLIKDDFLSLSQNASQILGFGPCTCFTSNSPFIAGQSGSGSTNLNQLTIADNVNYRVRWYDWMWIEPTAGVRYVNSSYASSAEALGLADGYIFRVQGGAKLGFDSSVNSNHLTTVLTGLLFDDVVVHGNNIQGGSFGQNGNILSDQGRVQAELIALLSLDLGHGVSASVEGDVYGARDIIGAGGKATIRMQW
jgi:Autotransporter beta-domain